ncbi:hypothetical protein U1708_04520 [Sphingomonas sp. ZB1N12]|jgi:hypothetical protein|uniref:hypothetical protein n=1 Tax=Sphingomonas arabinosi TaxID=3096160 RepID=UPI002FC9FBEA
MSALAISQYDSAAEPPIPVAVVQRAKRVAVYDFSADGRLVGAVAKVRSAWLCPLFYIVLPVSVVLVVVVAVLRLYHATARNVGRAKTRRDSDTVAGTYSYRCQSDI